jgi:hypothetical protein
MLSVGVTHAWMEFVRAFEAAVGLALQRRKPSGSGCKLVEQLNFVETLTLSSTTKSQQTGTTLFCDALEEEQAAPLGDLLVGWLD